MSSTTAEKVYPLTEGEAYAYTFVTLLVFGLVAGVATPLLAASRRKLDLKGDEGSDFWYSARNSQGAVPIAISVFATSAGAWLLYTPGEAAIVGGWWALIGYVVAIMLGPIVMCWLAPMVRDQVPDGANITDWIKIRFGPVAHTYATTALVFYMFIYLVTQLKIMGNTIEFFSGLDPLVALIPMSIVTLLYTMLGGLPASIVTDQVQGVVMLVFVVIVFLALIGWVDVSMENFAKVGTGTDTGFQMGVTLCLAVFGAEVFNLAFWQRVYAAKNTFELRVGLIAGSSMVGLLTLLFGIVGMLAKAQDLGRDAPHNFFPAMAFFDVMSMGKVTKGVSVVTYILAVCMIASCVDSFQTGITSIISREVLKRKMGTLKSMAIGELAVICVNVPAIIFASVAVKDTQYLNVKVLDLFAVADVFMITLVVPIFSGLWPFTTANGCLAGMASGVLTILAFGWAEFGTFIAGLEMLTLMTFGNSCEAFPTDPAETPCPTGLYAPRSCILFFVLPIITGLVTYLVSWMEHVLENARPKSLPGQVIGVPQKNAAYVTDHNNVKKLPGSPVSNSQKISC